MEVPILRFGSYLVASVQGELGDDDLQRLSENLTSRVRSTRSRGVVIDLTVLDVVDSFATRVLKSLTQMIRLLGADVVVVGIQPGVALAMVQMGLTLEGTPTALDFEDGMRYFEQSTEAGPRDHHI